MLIDVSELVGNPGQTRAESRSITRAEASTSGADWGPGEDVLLDPISIDFEIDAMIDGVYVHGTLAFNAEIPCARCLEPVSARHEVEVAEMFIDPSQAEWDDEPEEGYVISADGTSIDLETLLRDEILPALPVRIVHADEASCGDLWQEAGIDGAPGTPLENPPDPRWAALRGLDLPD